MLLKIKHEEAREKLILAAFVGFQMGAGGDKNFKQYLESLSLAKDSDAVETENITAEEAIKKAEDILAAASKKVKAE